MSNDETLRTHVPFRPSDMVAKLRHLADQLEKGIMHRLSGEIAIQCHLTGEVTINSDLVLSSSTQPPVVKHTLATDVYATLYGLGVGGVTSLSYDNDEEDEAREWFDIASDYSEYPLLMRRCRYHVQLSRGSVGTTIVVTRTA